MAQFNVKPVSEIVPASVMRRLGPSKREQTRQQYIAALRSLGPGEGLEIALEDGETALTIRNRVYSAMKRLHELGELTVPFVVRKARERDIVTVYPNPNPEATFATEEEEELPAPQAAPVAAPAQAAPVAAQEAPKRRPGRPKKNVA